tara:strand:- start:97945 stop:99099 length:1155 start_codon:yes stop_codon:yes gene_type:complete
MAMEALLKNGETPSDYWEPSVTSGYDLAIMRGDLKAIDLFLKYDHQVPLNAFMVAVQSGRLDLVPALVDRGGNIDAVANVDAPLAEDLRYVQTVAPALGQAVYNQDRNATKTLLGNGASPGFMMELAGFDAYFSPLHTAVHLRNVEVAGLLADAGAPLNVMLYGMTPLALAAQNGDLDILELLARHGAFIAYDDKYDQPISLALSNGHDQVVDWLVSQGVPKPESYDYLSALNRTGASAAVAAKKTAQVAADIAVVAIGIAIAVEASKYSTKRDLYLPPIPVALQSISSSTNDRNGYSSEPTIGETRDQNACSSDYSCGTGYSCIKKYLRNTGSCMKTLDSSGARTFDLPSTDSIGPNTMRQCISSSECPTGFQCEYSSGRCIK